MIRRLLLIVVLLAVFAVSLPARADIMLVSGPTSLTLSSDRNWTVVNMTWVSYPMMSNLGSNNGTVLVISNVFAGSGHGNEIVESTSLFVDGATTAIADESTYSGEIIKFTRTTILKDELNHDAFRLVSTMTMSESGTDERVMLDGLGSSKIVMARAAYGFLGTRANSLTQYASFNAKGELLSNGTTDRDDNSESPRMNPAVAVAQYDPVGQKGVLTQVIEGADLGLEPFIWDRPADNKLYFAFQAMGGPVGTNHYAMRQIVIPFDAAPDSWMATAGANVVPEPKMAVLLIALIFAILVYLSRHRAAVSTNAKYHAGMTCISTTECVFGNAESL